jgi:hypothetical protein
VSLPQLPTSLGPCLIADETGYHLDLANLPILRGMSVLSRALAEMAVHQARSGHFDVRCERQLRSRENPELCEQFGIESVRLQAAVDVVPSMLEAPERFERRLRAVFGSLQQPHHREALLVDGTPRALLAEFDDGDGVHRFVLERLATREPGRAALQLTIENAATARLAIERLTIVRLDDLGARSFIAGSTRIAETWTEALRREAERGRRSFVEGRSPHSHLFQQLDQAAWNELQRVALHWSEGAHAFLLASEPAAVRTLLKRVLLACEDRNVRALLAQRQAVCVDTGALPVWIECTQLGRVLDLSLGERRPRNDADAFLARMPNLSALLDDAVAKQPLRGVRVFLVHHMTAEIVGTIAALRAAGCRDLTVLFVTYAGEPPATYLDAVLALPEDEFRALALVNVPTPGHFEGRYRLSTHYSKLAEAPAIAAALQQRGDAYLPAMQAAAWPPFAAQLARAEAAGDRLLLIEDGGYLAPALQQAMLENRSVQELVRSLGHDSDDRRAVRDLLPRRLPVTVEHTRNGFDKLQHVESRFGRLFVPSLSIAISDLKRRGESREVADAILLAIESVLHADGRILSRRRWLVLGSLGAIGREVVHKLLPRLDRGESALFGIDLLAGRERSPCTATRTLGELGEAHWLATDVVLGVTGDSVLQGADIERWLVGSDLRTLTLASGSTKKVEFRTVMAWFDALVQQPEPSIAGRRVAIRVDELLDPRTSRLYGHRWTFTFADDGRVRSVLALGNLTPINFLFYGVPTECIDEVLTQLVSLAFGAVLAPAGSLPNRLLAVDRDVDSAARLLHPATR